MSSLWQQEHTASPGREIDSSSANGRVRPAGQSWMKRECDLDVGPWDVANSGIASDAEQDDTLSSAMSTTALEGLPPRVLLTVTKLRCLLQIRQERIRALERQVADLQQDRRFLREQIENLTNNKRQEATAPILKPSRPQSSEPRPRKRQREASSSSSIGEVSGSELSVSSDSSGASDEHKKRKHRKQKGKGKKGKDYSRKRATGVQYVIHRYKQVLSAFNKKKSMTGAFKHYGIDRNTIANTAPIAELHLADKDALTSLVGLFRPREETLVSYAQKCALVIETDLVLSRKIEQMKASGELLPMSAKRGRTLLMGDSLLVPLHHPGIPTPQSV